MLTKKTVKPSDFEVRDHLWNSPFQNEEKETIARNIILISQWSKDRWLDFTWDEYQTRCKHKVTWAEHQILEEFVLQGLLSFDNGSYSVSDAFIQKLEQFVKPQKQKKEYILYVYCRRNDVSRDAGEHARDTFENDEQAKEELLKKARDLKRFYDTVQATIKENDRLVCRQDV